MTSIEVQGAVVVAPMQDIAGRVYEPDAPVLDGGGGLPLPLDGLASYLYHLAILIQPDEFLSVSRFSLRSQQVLHTYRTWLRTHTTMYALCKGSRDFR